MIQKYLLEINTFKEKFLIIKKLNFRYLYWLLLTFFIIALIHSLTEYGSTVTVDFFKSLGKMENFIKLEGSVMTIYFQTEQSIIKVWYEKHYKNILLLTLGALEKIYAYFYLKIELLFACSIIINIAFSFSRFFKKSQFNNNWIRENFSVFSHDVKFHLTSIILALNLISKIIHDHENKEILKYKSIIEKNQKSIIYLTDNYLCLNKLDLDNKSSLEKINVFLFLEEIINEIKPHALNKNILVSLDEIENEVYISTSHNKLKQVIINLLINAIKFSRPQDIVIVKIKKFNGRVRITITDTGVGITSNIQKQIFKKALNRPSSSGLGLYIAQKIVRSLKGEIGFHSEASKGSQFWVDFPES